MRSDLRWLVLALLVASSGCAARYTLVKTEQIGPAYVEVWKDRTTHTCERRTFFAGYYYHGKVECPR